MGAKRLGAVDITASTQTLLYTPPTNTGAAITASLCNRNSASVLIRLALCTSASSASPAAGEYVEYNTTLPANGILERTGLIVASGQYVVAYCNSAGVSGLAFGIESQLPPNVTGGRLGANDMTAASNTTLYACPSNSQSVVTINCCNRNSASSTTVRLAICNSASPAASEYIEYDTVLPANGVLERTGLALDGGKYLVGYCASSSVSMTCYGYTEP